MSVLVNLNSTTVDSKCGKRKRDMNPMEENSMSQKTA